MSKHAVLLEFVITHPYYQDEACPSCPDFSIQLTEQTSQLLLNHRCVPRISPSGLSILTPVQQVNGKDVAKDVALLPFSDDARLEFWIFLNNPDFERFTLLADILEQKPPVFRNANPDRPNALTLHHWPTSTKDEVRPALPSGAFALVQIALQGLLGSDSAWPVRFTLAFEAKSLKWTYYCVTWTHEGQTPLQLSITDKAEVNAPKVTFDKPTVFNAQSTSQGDDRIAKRLVEQYGAKTTVLRFVSLSPVDCRLNPPARLELSRPGGGTGPNEKSAICLVSVLPNPSLRHVSKDGALVQIVKDPTLQQQNQG